MTHQEKNNQTDRGIIHRRRLAAIAILLIVVPLGMALQDTRVSPLTWLVNASNSGVYAEGDPFGEWMFVQCDGKAQQVLVLKDGNLHGIQALENLAVIEKPDFCSLPLVDHPNLVEWSQQHQQLVKLADDPATPADQILSAATTMPLTSLYLEPLNNWITSDPAHGAEILDIISARGREGDFPGQVSRYAINVRVAEANFTSVLNLAVSSALANRPSPQQLSRWLESTSLVEESDLVEQAAVFVNVERGYEDTLPMLLEQLDEVPRSRRPQVFQQLVGQLLSQPVYAPLVVDQLEALPNADVLSLSEWMLGQPGTEPALAYELLADFDDIYTGSERELIAFRSIGNFLREVPGTAYRLADALDDLSDRERRLAAIYMLELDNDGKPEFTMAMLEEFDELHDISKPLVLHALLATAQFDHSQVQQKAWLVANTHLQGQSKREIFSAMHRHRSLDPDIRDRLALELD